jgi:hypothetical protein
VLFRHGCRTGELSGGIINDPDRAVEEYLQVLANLGDFFRNHWKTLVDEIQKDLKRKSSQAADPETLADKPDIIVSGKLAGVNPIRITQTYKEFPGSVEIPTKTTVGDILEHMLAAGADATKASFEAACLDLTTKTANDYLRGAEFKRKAAECVKNLKVELPAVIKNASLSTESADAVKLAVKNPAETLAKASGQGINLHKIQTRLQYLKEFL